MIVKKQFHKNLNFSVCGLFQCFYGLQLSFLKIPIPLLREFIDENISKSLHFLMTPAFVWSVCGMFYGMKKGYLGKGGHFGSSE